MTGYRAFMGATYDNGDRSDNWCGSHTQVPQEMIGPAYYDAPQCGNRNIFVIGKTIDQMIWRGFVDFVICN
jgi:hypothetical protein